MRERSPARSTRRTVRALGPRPSAAPTCPRGNSGRTRYRETASGLMSIGCEFSAACAPRFRVCASLGHVPQVCFVFVFVFPTTNRLARWR